MYDLLIEVGARVGAVVTWSRPQSVALSTGLQGATRSQGRRADKGKDRPPRPALLPWSKLFPDSAIFAPQLPSPEAPCPTVLAWPNPTLPHLAVPRQQHLLCQMADVAFYSSSQKGRAAKLISDTEMVP